MQILAVNLSDKNEHHSVKLYNFARKQQLSVISSFLTSHYLTVHL